MIKFNIANQIYEFYFNVLAVDDDYTHLKLLVKTLTTFGYDVIELQNPQDGLAILRTKRRFDIVICGVSISENLMAFNLLRTAVVEFKIPVILMLSNPSNEEVLYGILGGASQCVAKLPVVDHQILKTIWQHIVSRRPYEYFSSIYVRQIQPSSNETSLLKVVDKTASATGYGGGPSTSSNPTSFMETRSSFPKIAYEGGSSCTENVVPIPTYEGGSNCYSSPNVNLKKISDEKSESFDHDHHQHIPKKRRFNWTDEYQQIFLDAIKDIAVKEEKIVPANIMTYMKSRGVSNITRANIASHLQKFRTNNEKGNKGIEKSSHFVNSCVTPKYNLKGSCPSKDPQTLTKTQTILSQDLPKQDQETSPITQPIDHTMQDINDDIFLEYHEIIPNCPMKISHQPQEVGQESNNDHNFAFEVAHINKEEPDPSIVSVDHQNIDTNGKISHLHDHPLSVDFNEDHFKNGHSNEYVSNSQVYDSFESFENLPIDHCFPDI